MDIHHRLSADVERPITRLNKSVKNAVNARNPAQRSAAQSFLVQRANELVAMRDALAVKLDAGWAYLAPDYDQTPPESRASHEDRKYEDMWLQWLSDYEAIDDALRDAFAAWLMPEAA